MKDIQNDPGCELKLDGNAVAGKHRADGHGAEIGKQVGEEFAVHAPAPAARPERA